jgi:hypothetical protein
VLVFTDGMAPVIGWAERYWRRPDVRALSHPGALDVRVRTAWARATAVVRTQAAAVCARVWRRPVRGWVARKRAEPATLAAAARAGVAAWRDRSTGEPAPVGASFGEPETVPASEPAAAASAGSGLAEPAGAEVIPFPTAEWPAPDPAATPIVPAGDRSSDNGHSGDVPGRWN